MSKRIPLTQGKFAIVDDADFDWLSEHRWTAARIGATWYAQERIHGRTVYMHRLILNPPLGMESDHVNGDGLDNQRHNLRICTRTENAWNVKKRPGCSSKYKGIYWFGSRQKWHARIEANGRRYHLGYFQVEADAATAYNVAAVIYFGAFARLNVIEEKP